MKIGVHVPQWGDDASRDLAVDDCMVRALKGEWAQMVSVLESGLLDGVPINTTATYVGDALFAKPIPMILEKTRLILENGAKPIVVCYADADVNNADRLLFKSGLLGPGSYWLILPALPGGSPMGNPRQMFEELLRMHTAITDVDPDATIVVCAAGRPSTDLVTIACRARSPRSRWNGRRGLAVPTSRRTHQLE